MAQIRAIWHCEIFDTTPDVLRGCYEETAPVEFRLDGSPQSVPCTDASLQLNRNFYIQLFARKGYWSRCQVANQRYRTQDAVEYGEWKRGTLSPANWNKLGIGGGSVVSSYIGTRI